MGITSVNPTVGVVVTSAAMNETLGNQSQQTGNNTVVVSDDIPTLSNGNLETSPVYNDRLVIIRQGAGDEELRYILSTASGTGNTEILTVSEDWDLVPADSDTIHVSYIIQDAATVTGFTLVNKTVQDYNSSRRFTIGSGSGTFAFIAFINGVGLQSDDNGSTTVAAITIEDGGRFDCGYLDGGNPTSGCKIQFANGSDGELALEMITNAEFNCFASYIDGVNRELVDFNTSTTSKIRMRGVRWTFAINDIIWGVQDTDLNDVAFLSDGGGTTPRINVRDWLTGNQTKNLLLNGFDGLESNTSGDDPELRNITFVRMSKLMTIATAENWVIVNPVGMDISTLNQDDVSIAGTGDLIKKFEFRNKSHDLTDNPLTAKQYVTARSFRATLDSWTVMNEDVADSNGESVQDTEVTLYVDSGGTSLTASSTTTFIEHSAKYGFIPIAKSILPANEDETVFPTKYGKAIDYAHSVDDFQVEGTAATARTLGDATNAVAIHYQRESGQASGHIVKYTGGSGTLVVGDTFKNDNNSAEHIVAEIIEGDSVAGTVILQSFNNINVVDVTQIFDNDGGGWTANYTSASLLEYEFLIDADGLSPQELYDYLNAKLDETTLDQATPIFMNYILAWGTNGTSALPFVGDTLGSPNKFKSVRNASIFDGWAVYNLGGVGLGGITGYEDNNGDDFVPAASVTVTIHCERKDTGANIQSVQVIVTLVSDGSEVDPTGVTDSNGDYSFSYTYTGDVNVNIFVRKGTSGDVYIPDDGVNTIKSSGMNQTFLMVIDTNNN